MGKVNKSILKVDNHLLESYNDARISVDDMCGEYPSYRIHMTGEHLNAWNIGGILQDVGSYMDATTYILNDPSPSDILYLRSTSNQDILGGTGQSHVGLLGIKDNEIYYQNIAFNGTTNVVLGSGFTKLQVMEPNTPSDTARRVMAGRGIVSKHISDNTSINVICDVLVGTNRSNIAYYTVPPGHIFLMDTWYYSSPDFDIKLYLRIDQMMYSNIISVGDFHFKQVRDVKAGFENTIYFHYKKKVLPGASILVSALPVNTSANCKLSTNFDGLLIDLR